MYVILVETKKKDDLGGSSWLRILGRTSAAAASWIPRESTKFSSVVRLPIGGCPPCRLGYCSVRRPRGDHRCRSHPPSVGRKRHHPPKRQPRLLRWRVGYRSQKWRDDNPSRALDHSRAGQPLPGSRGSRRSSSHSSVWAHKIGFLRRHCSPLRGADNGYSAHPGYFLSCVSINMIIHCIYYNQGDNKISICLGLTSVTPALMHRDQL